MNGFERNWYFQWQKKEYRCIIDLKDPGLQWKGEIDFNGIKYSAAVGGLYVELSNGDGFVLSEGATKVPGAFVSVADIDGDKYIHVAWSAEGKQYEATTSANHWYAIRLKPFSTIHRKHIARMNRFVRRVAGRSHAETWVSK